MLENFSFTAAYGQMIRDGREAELVKDVVLAGNLFQTLDRIDHIAGDFRWNQMGGGCGKGRQYPLAVPEGAPHGRTAEGLPPPPGIGRAPARTPVPVQYRIPSSPFKK